MGICDELDEKYMDAITAVSGSGPGYLSIIIEAMTYAGLKVGLPRDIALTCAAQTVMGAGKLVIDLHEDPSKIKDMTTTRAAQLSKPYTRLNKAKLDRR